MQSGQRDFRTPDEQTSSVRVEHEGGPSFETAAAAAPHEEDHGCLTRLMVRDDGNSPWVVVSSHPRAETQDDTEMNLERAFSGR